jgi:hypothetical protein
MKTIRILLLSVMALSLAISCSAQTSNKEETAKISNGDKLEVYYFHNTRRCATCQAVEAVTKRTLEDNYPEQMKEGTITFQSLNIEEDVNEPLARKLHVSGQTLLFIKDGKKRDLTNDAFMYARTNPDKLQEKIIKTIDNL